MGLLGRIHIEEIALHLKLVTAQFTQDLLSVFLKLVNCTERPQYYMREGCQDLILF